MTFLSNLHSVAFGSLDCKFVACLTARGFEHIWTFDRYIIAFFQEFFDKRNHRIRLGRVRFRPLGLVSLDAHRENILGESEVGGRPQHLMSPSLALARRPETRQLQSRREVAP